MTKYEKIDDLIVKNTKSLVGVLLKRIEVLNAEDKFSPQLYKALVKEIVWENSRGLRNVIKVFLNFDSINYQSNDK